MTGSPKRRSALAVALLVTSSVSVAGFLLSVPKKPIPTTELGLSSAFSGHESDPVPLPLPLTTTELEGEYAGHSPGLSDSMTDDVCVRLIRAGATMKLVGTWGKDAVRGNFHLGKNEVTAKGGGLTVMGHWDRTEKSLVLLREGGCGSYARADLHRCDLGILQIED